MNALSLAEICDQLDYTINRVADKPVFETYNAGKTSFKKSSGSDVEFLSSVFDAYTEYRQRQLRSLPDGARELETIKFRLLQDTLRSIVSVLKSSDIASVDKANSNSLFFYYYLGYVSDIIKQLTIRAG